MPTEHGRHWEKTTNYDLAYRIGFHPWEDAEAHEPFVQRFSNYSTRKRAGAIRPTGPRSTWERAAGSGQSSWLCAAGRSQVSTSSRGPSSGRRIGSRKRGSPCSSYTATLRGSAQLALARAFGCSWIQERFTASRIISARRWAGQSAQSPPPMQPFSCSRGRAEEGRSFAASINLRSKPRSPVGQSLTSGHRTSRHRSRSSCC